MSISSNIYFHRDHAKKDTKTWNEIENAIKLFHLNFFFCAYVFSSFCRSSYYKDQEKHQEI